MIPRVDDQAQHDAQADDQQLGVVLEPSAQARAMSRSIEREKRNDPRFDCERMPIDPERKKRTPSLQLAGGVNRRFTPIDHCQERKAALFKLLH